MPVLSMAPPSTWASRQLIHFALANHTWLLFSETPLSLTPTLWATTTLFSMIQVILLLWFTSIPPPVPFSRTKLWQTDCPGSYWSCFIGWWYLVLYQKSKLLPRTAQILMLPWTQFRLLLFIVNNNPKEECYSTYNSTGANFQERAKQ